MASEGQDFKMTAGDTRVLRIAVTDTDGEQVDLAGATARWWMARSSRSTGASVLVQKSTSGGVSIDEQTGIVTVTISPADTEGLSAGLYYHELEIVDGNGAVSTVTTGKVTMRDALIPEA
mgnify:FL=1